MTGGRWGRHQIRKAWNWLRSFIGYERKTRAVIVAELRDNALLAATKPVTSRMIIAPRVNAEIEELMLRLDRNRGDVLSLGVEVLMQITEAGGSTFIVERGDKRLTFGIRAAAELKRADRP